MKYSVSRLCMLDLILDLPFSFTRGRGATMRTREITAHTGQTMAASRREGRKLKASGRIRRLEEVRWKPHILVFVFI